MKAIENTISHLVKDHRLDFMTELYSHCVLATRHVETQTGLLKQYKNRGSHRETELFTRRRRDCDRPSSIVVLA